MSVRLPDRSREGYTAWDGAAFAGLLFRGLLEMVAKLDFAEDALTLKLLFQHLESLVDVVVANENLHAWYPVLPM